MLCEMFCSASSVSGDGVVNGVQVDGVAEHLLRHGGRVSSGVFSLSAESMV